ncbi:MAG: hypothetical protein LBD17_00215 [Endomicrobium sp.]|nr:hypothetical protein [Endomicrobium sp.]
MQNRPLSIVIGGRDLNPSGIVGVPILGFENGKPELSHIELRNCLMSHQYFRNYGIFTKLELAVLRDLGYPIDLENFWGYSIYDDSGTYTLSGSDSFCARVPVADQPGIYEYEIETPNPTPLTIGLHIYGHNNTVRLVDGYSVLQSGNGSAGIRVDGWEKIVEIGNDSQIMSAGEDGIGMMVCYGKGHRIYQNAYADTMVVGTGSEIIGDIVSKWNPFKPFVQYDDRTRHTLHPKIYFGGRRDESTDSLVADSSYNGTFIGNISAEFGALDVCLMGGTLNWGRRDDDSPQKMSALERFRMCRGTCLRLESDFVHIAAKELMFEPDTTIITPSRRNFRIHVEVPEDIVLDCDSFCRNVKFKDCDSGQQNSFDIDYLVEEPDDVIHPKSRIYKFFKPSLEDFFMDDSLDMNASWDVDDF